MLKFLCKNYNIVMKYCPGACVIYSLISLFKSCVAVLTVALLEILINQLISDFTVSGTVHLMWVLVLCVFFLVVVVMEFISNVILSKIQISLSKKFVPDVIYSLNKINYECFENPDLQTDWKNLSVKPHERLLDFFKSTHVLIRGIISVVLLGLYFLRFSYIITISYLAVIVLIVYFNFFSYKTVEQLLSKSLDSEKYLEYMLGLLIDKKHVFEIRIFRAIDFIKNKIANESNRVHAERVRLNIRSQKYYIISSFITLVWIAFILLFIINSALLGKQSIGSIVAVIVSLESVILSCDDLSLSVLEMMRKSVFVNSFLKTKQLANCGGPSIDERMCKVVKDIKEEKIHKIKFDNVTYVYPNASMPTLLNVSVEFTTSEKIAIVGLNGHGKSTFVKLLLNLIYPTSGQIYIDEIPISDYSRSQLSNIFVAVFQDCNLYEFSLSENIALGRENVGNIEDLLKRFGVDKNLSLSDNFGHMQEEGKWLSSGQIQRVSILRALYGGSKFLIMDEPAAKLDAIIENELYTKVFYERKDNGCLFITHRIGSVKVCDRIILINNGTILSEGRHDYLIESCSLYRQIYLEQRQLYQNVKNRTKKKSMV